MSNSVIQILSTRPLDAQLIEAASAKGIEVHETSFISTEPIVDPATVASIKSFSNQPITAVFTSMNAVTAVAAQSEAISPLWDVYCLGNTTMALVQQFFPQARIAGTGNSAKDLAEKIVSDNPVNSIVFFCGNQRRDELPQVLQQNHLQLKELVVYTTAETAEKVNQDFDGILFFSPSAVRSFFSVNQLPAQTILFCVGATTAAEVSMYCNNQVIIADAPDKNAVLQTAINYFLNQEAFNEQNF